jgi:YD repeat-containing protein
VNGDGYVDGFDIEGFFQLRGTSEQVVPSVRYTWDAENRLTALAPATDNWVVGDWKLEFAYDFAGRRVQRKASRFDGVAWVLVEDRKFVYDGWLLLMELDGLNGDAITREYTWGLDVGSAGILPANARGGAGGIGGLLAADDTGGAAPTRGDPAFIYFYDGHGNVGQLVETTAGDNYGTLAATYEYDPYGNIVVRDTNDDGNWLDEAGSYAHANPFRFSTKYWM